MAQEQNDFTQRWLLMPNQAKPVWDGYYALRQKSSGRYLTMEKLLSGSSPNNITFSPDQALELVEHIDDGTPEDPYKFVKIRVDVDQTNLGQSADGEQTGSSAGVESSGQSTAPGAFLERKNDGVGSSSVGSSSTVGSFPVGSSSVGSSSEAAAHSSSGPGWSGSVWEGTNG